MTTFSIRHQSDSKEYLWLIPSHGLEMGFGSAGEYEAHAHRHFVDVIYSPGGLRLSPGDPSAHIAVVPPRTAFGPTLTAEFFFLKFLPEPGNHTIPDKVVGAAVDHFPRAPPPTILTEPFSVWLSHFDPRDSSNHRISIRSSPGRLLILSTAGWSLTIEP